MAPIIEVKSLPVLNQDDPDNPLLPAKMEGWVVRLFSDPDDNSLTQMLASALIQACMGEWKPVSRAVLIETLRLYVGDGPLAINFWEDFAELEAGGYVEIMRCDGVEYVVPQPSFGQKFLSNDSIVEYQPARDLLPQQPMPKRRGWGSSIGRSGPKTSAVRL